MRVFVTLFCLGLTLACAPPAGGSRSGGGNNADAGNMSADAGVECTRSSDCAEGFRCISNACEEIDQGCANDRDCRIGERCDNDGQCVEAGGGNNGGCQTNADCTQQGQICDNGTCKSGAYGSCTSDADCASGTGCLLQSQDGQRVCGTLCQQSAQCANHESCQQATVCVPNQCQTPNQACDAHGTDDGLCVTVGQSSVCVKGASNGAGCEPFGASTCSNGEICQPVGAMGSDTYCGSTQNLEAGAPCEKGMLTSLFADEDCAAGNTCVPTQQGTLCLPYCRAGQNTDCPTVDGTAFNCVPLSQINQQFQGSPWGLCQPQQ